VARRARRLSRRRARCRGASPAERRGSRRADGRPRRLGQPEPGATCCRERVMLRVGFQTLRFRTAGFVASFVVLMLGATVVMACGGLMESGIRTTVLPKRLAAPPLVVTRSQSYRDQTLPARARLSPFLISRPPALPAG